MEYRIPDDALSPGVFHAQGADKLPGHLGFDITSMTRDRVEGRFEVRQTLMAPNGYLHGGTVVAFADTLAGYLTVANLRADEGFTTVELKTNFFSTLLEGWVSGSASVVHRGKTTAVIDVEVLAETTGRRMALFRCTNLILKPG
ncbi:MAG: PaaI family thioesterase [Pseudomonadota bacterium]